MLVMTTDDHINRLLYYNSTDGLKWVGSEANPVLEGRTGYWDQNLYNSSFFEHNGIFDVWYVGISADNVWKVGYTQLIPFLIADAGPDQTVTVNEPVMFDGSGSTDSDGTIVFYAWDFGDSKTGSDMTTSHAYTAAGAYTVALTVTDNDGLTGSDTALITVNVPVKVRIVPNTLNTASKGKFVAFITLPRDYKAADVDPKSIVCEGAPALRLIRGKWFPKTFVAIFNREKLVNVKPGDKVKVTVIGTINKNGQKIGFRGSDEIKVISKKGTIKEPIDDVDKLTDEKVFSQFNPQ